MSETREYTVLCHNGQIIKIMASNFYAGEKWFYFYVDDNSVLESLYVPGRTVAAFPVKDVYAAGESKLMTSLLMIELDDT